MAGNSSHYQPSHDGKKMATIKPIEGRSVHQIQSGQVIVDLCSVVKELVENSLDARATSIEVRFKNDGLDTIEVQDNGSGIEPENYENIALKHYTSKLASYDDLTSLTTFGFRGEALSSLCAVSDFHIVTAQAQQAPKANKLEFEHSGKLKGTQVVAGQKGTTVSISNLFARLPVRRKELEKNIKRELAKVVNLLNEYACINTGVRFSVKNTDLKKRQLVLLTTKANASIRDNIANVYGAKTLLTLIPLELDLEFEPSATGMRLNRDLKRIHVRGYVSRPVVGEGRGTRDRQMYYVNSRPCGIPQIAKAFNEVYKSYNLTQAPFVLADFQMDTNAYDVNVSPDKRTILLHESASLIESLKEALDTMFQQAEQTVPQSQYANHTPQTSLQQKIRSSPVKPASEMNRLDHSFPQENFQIERVESEKVVSAADEQEAHTEEGQEDEINDSQVTTIDADADKNAEEVLQRIRARAAESALNSPELPISTLKRQSSTRETGVIENAFDRMRSRRPPAEVATITIGDKITTSIVGYGGLRKRDSFTAGHAASKRQSKRRVHKPSRPNIFGQNLKSFAAPGTQTQPHDEETDDDADEIAGSSDEEVLDDSPSPVESDELPRDSSSVEDVRESIADEIETSTQEVASRDTNNDAADEENKRAEEKAKVEELIRKAEEKGVPQSEIHIKRGKYIEKDQKASKDSTASLVGVLESSLVRIQQKLSYLQKRLSFYEGHEEAPTDEAILAGQQKIGEERLSLTVSKEDFVKMRIVGQFNLGFILATRSHQGEESTPSTEDELFIIDQHASDEKYNFERFQAETVVQNQRLVHPKVLELTAVEEEIIRENQQALEKNGFIVEIDDSGDEPVGRRCSLVSLPLSKEVVFGIKDLEELIVLLSEAPPGVSTGKRSSLDIYVPRPSKVRKMFAMRACRSSIMIGKTLTMKQMERAVRNLGKIDKPWNCPHGRPTMRHLMSLGSWHDYDEHTSIEQLNTTAKDSRNPWQRFYDQWRQEEQEVEEEEDNGDE